MQTAPPPPQTTGEAPLGVIEIGQAFAANYYETLYSDSSNLFKFYRSDATLSIGFGNVDSETFHGPDQIKQGTIKTFKSCSKVSIGVVDVQDLCPGAVLVMVKGEISFGDIESAPFSQSFAIWDRGDLTFFVKNDIFRTEAVHSKKTSQNLDDQNVVHKVSQGFNPHAATNGSITTNPSRAQQDQGQGDVSSVKSVASGDMSDVDSTAATVGTMSTTTLSSFVGADDTGSHSDINSESSALRDSGNLEQFKRATTLTPPTSTEKPKSSKDLSPTTTDIKSSPSNITKPEKPTAQEPNTKPAKKQKNKKRSQKSRKDGQNTESNGPITYASIVSQINASGAVVESESPTINANGEKSQNSDRATTTAPTSAPAQVAESKPSKQPTTTTKKEQSEESTRPRKKSQHKNNDQKLQTQQKKHNRKQKEELHAVYISRLIPGTTDDELRQIFDKFGEIIEINNKALDGQRYAFIFYQDRQGMNRAIEANNTNIVIRSQRINVEERTSEKGRGGARPRGDRRSNWVSKKEKRGGEFKNVDKKE